MQNRLTYRTLNSVDDPGLVLGTRPSHGREQHLQLIADLLHTAAESRRSQTVLIDGPPGIGKSRLLAEAVQAAAKSGFTVVHRRADELQQLVPLAPLLGALGESLLPPPGGEDDKAGDLAGRHLWLLGKLRVRIEERLTRTPMLIALDDLQWADDLTLLALRTLQLQLASYPLVWVLARRSNDSAAGVARLFALLEETGSAVRIELGPLPDEAVADLLRDLLSATPDPELLTLAYGADGNPLALIELIEGLADESAVRIDNGMALLATPPASTPPGSYWDRREHLVPGIWLPRRFRALVHRRLDALSPRTRCLLQTATVLGQSFLLDDLSEMTAESPAALMPALQEALTARLLVCTADTLAFRHELIWRVLLDTVPAPVRGALHRQVAEMQLGRGGSVVDAAVHLLHGARRGDHGTIEILQQAATEVLPSVPQAAAELAMRGLELTEPADPAHLALTTTAVEALTRAGPLSTATTLARDALSQPLPTAPAASLRYWLSTALLLGGDVTDAVAEAKQILAEPGLPTNLHDEAELNLLAGLSVLDGPAAAQRGEAVVGDTEPDNPDILVGALAVLAQARWREGRLEEAQRFARQAVGCAETGSAVAWHIQPRLTLAVILTHLRDFPAAAIAIRMAREEIESRGAGVLRAVPMIFQAYLELTAGNIGDAVATATAGVAVADETGMPRYTPIGWSVLATAALRRGDLVTAVAHAKLLEALSADGTQIWRAQRAWVTAQVADATSHPEAALRAVADSYPSPFACRDLFVEEPAAAAWLIRAARSAGADQWATAVAATAERLAADNPDVPVVRAAAAHARGLCHRDSKMLEQAIREHRDPWARASAAEDLGTMLIDVDRDAAVHHLDQAMASYGRVGAERDAARVRRRLRHVGVRRRHWTYADRPTSGWASLTETERAVANLVAQGFTNRQVAGQMFLSPHTVGFHLRQVFRKLGIHSRVDLVRRNLETPGPEQPT
jgi:ATP/maltotriose-dependent transcriptional regulator MalT